MIQPRGYQQKAIQEVLARLIACGRVLLWSPTGSGKTCIAAWLIQQFLADSRWVLFLAHRKELVDQCCNKLNALGIPHGVIMAGVEPDPFAPVQVASIQTLARREMPWEPGVIIIDECHHATAATYARILEQFPRAVVLGLTATPFRSDGIGLGDTFLEVVQASTVAQLTAMGFLVPARYFGPDMPDLRGIGRKGGDFDAEDLAARMGKPKIIGSVVENYKIHAMRPTGYARGICFCVNQAHSKQVAQAFNDAGIPAAHLGDDCTRRERERILADHMAGVLQVITNVNILSEGYDSPAVELCISVRPTLSLSLWLQQIGRVLRPCPGKARAVVIDHAGNARRHGFADDEFEADLRSGVQRRQAREIAPALKTCLQCYAIVPAAEPVCPCCGAAMGKPPRTIIEKDGALVEITKPTCPCGSFDTEKKADPVKGYGLFCSGCGKVIRWLGKPDKAREEYLADYLAVGRAADYKGGWSGMRFRARYGTWPSKAEIAKADQILIEYLADCIVQARDAGRDFTWVEGRFKDRFGAPPVDSDKDRAHEIASHRIAAPPAVPFQEVMEVEP